MAEAIIPFWNQKQLNPPPIKSLKIVADSPERISLSVASILENIILQLSEQDLLHCDAALISRLLFRTKRNLRSHKGYKCFQRVQRFLSNYLSLDLLSTVRQVRHTAYGAFGPSREVLEWCLLSFQRFSALFHGLQSMCYESAYYMHNHITTGDNWHLALLFLACVSRVWTISRHLVAQACEWYAQLEPFLSQLESSEKWLPSDYQLPADLKSWLGQPDYLDDPNKTVEGDKKLKGLLDPENIILSLSFNEDLGEPVTRSNGPPKQLKKAEVVFKKCEDITLFMKMEEQSRQSWNSNSKTKNLNNEEWQRMKNYLRKTYSQLKTMKDRRTLTTSLHYAQNKLNKWINNK